jgi:membrane-associated phospholipid phosphatase
MAERVADSSRVAWLTGAVAVALYLPLTLAVAFASQPYFELDVAMSRSIQSTRSPAIETLTHLTSMADNNVVGPTVLIGIACAVLAVFRLWREAAVLLGVVLLGQASWVLCGWLVNRPRPDPELIHVLIDVNNVHGFPSYPSGHCVYYTAYFGFLSYVTIVNVKATQWRWPLLMLLTIPIALVGFARIFLGAHWITDVIGGYLLGAAILSLGIGIHKRWMR